MNLSERMASSIKEAGIKKSDLAKKLGISPSAVTQWINGSTTSIDGDNLVRTATILNVDATWLATGSGERYVKKENKVRREINDVLDQLPDELHKLVLEQAKSILKIM
jgi:transcriptional regulator with XRE-family HTH domain